MKEQWFPAAEGKQVVGRFIDIEKPDVAASKERGEPVYVLRPALESKVIGSHDTSIQQIKEFNQQALIERFPGAWDHYEQQKAAAAEPQRGPPVVQTIKGTPISDADFVPHDRHEWLSHQGIQTVEQIRDLSDAQCQAMGKNAFQWRKQAKAWLERT